MRKIIYAFSSPKETMLFSEGIKIIEKRKFSHALIIYTDPYTGIKMVSQASHGMVNECSLDLFLYSNNIIVAYEQTVSEAQFKKFMINHKLKLGIKYSFIQILAIFISKIIKRNIDYKNGTLAYICSEWVAENAKLLDLQIRPNLDLKTPSNLNEEMKVLGLTLVQF